MTPTSIFEIMHRALKIRKERKPAVYSKINIGQEAGKIASECPSSISGVDFLDWADNAVQALEAKNA